MSNETDTPKEGEIVEVKAEIVEGTPETSAIAQETRALMEAIRTQAQSQVQGVADFTREAYLDAVRKAREEVEKVKPFAPERVEEAIKQVKAEVDKDWDALAKEIKTLGDRLSDAAKAAWEKLTAPRPDDSSSDSE